MNSTPFLISTLLSLWFGGCIQAGAKNSFKETETANILPVSQEAQQQDPALLTVQQFYVKYITEWVREGGTDHKKTEAIQKQYITRRLWDRLQIMFQELELDYDPFLEAQDCDKSVLEKLRIEKDSVQANVYRVYLWDNFNQKYEEVRLLLKQEGQGYKIDDILSLSDYYRNP